MGVQIQQRSSAAHAVVCEATGDSRRRILVGVVGVVLGLWGAAMAMPAQRHLPATETNHRQHSLVEWNSTVIVGVPHTLRYDANIILKRFQKLHPNTRVVVREYSEDECFVQLASGKVHLVLSERSISEKEAEAMTRINRDVAQMILPIGVQSDKQNGQFLHMTAWGDALRCQSALNAFVNCSRTVARKQFAEIEVAWVAEPLRTQN